jgi:hypothetical protein
MNGQHAQAGASSSALLDVLALRSGTAYREAERLRRRIGSSRDMAMSSMTSDEYAAVRLLIGTWDSIAARVRAGDIPMDPFFESNPVIHMWDALSDAITVIKRRSKGPKYAENFKWLCKKCRAWLKKPKNRKYRTASVQGINAHFG